MVGASFWSDKMRELFFFREKMTEKIKVWIRISERAPHILVCIGFHTLDRTKLTIGGQLTSLPGLVADHFRTRRHEHGDPLNSIMTGGGVIKPPKGHRVDRPAFPHLQPR